MAWPAKANRGKGCLSVYLFAGLGSDPAISFSLTLRTGQDLPAVVDTVTVGIINGGPGFRFYGELEWQKLLRLK